MKEELESEIGIRREMIDQSGPEEDSAVLKRIHDALGLAEFKLGKYGNINTYPDTKIH